MQESTGGSPGMFLQRRFAAYALASYDLGQHQVELRCLLHNVYIAIYTADTKLFGDIQQRQHKLSNERDRPRSNTQVSLQRSDVALSHSSFDSATCIQKSKRTVWSLTHSFFHVQ